MTACSSRRSALAAVVVVASIVVGCGSDGAAEPADDAEAAVVSSTVGSADGVPTDVSSAPPADTPTADTSTADGSTADASTPTGEEICARLNVDSVAAAIGLDVMAAAPDDSATPQCAYDYTNESGATSNLTVAVMRPEDVRGATGSDVFDLVVEINRGLGGDDVDEQEIDAGDGAIRLSGPALHLGVVRVGDHVYTLIVPADDAEADAVDRLIGTMATTLG